MMAKQLQLQAGARTSMRLVDVAMGRKPADLVVRSGRWVCVQSGEILPETDVAISGQRIAYIGPQAEHTIGPDTHVLEARDRYLVPGLLDGHMHVESSLLTLTAFVQVVLPHGTTGIFPDPHEMVNVLGLEGVRMMWEEGRVQPIHVWHQMPASAPTMPRFETSGAKIGPADVRTALAWPDVVGLGEIMDQARLLEGDHDLHAVVAQARAQKKAISGHYASPDLGRRFSAYLAAGIGDDHEGTTVEDAIARARQGLCVMLRRGTTTDDMTPQLPAVLERGLDSRHFILVTDGSDADTLLREGHMDRVVRQAIAGGLDPMRAIQMVTLNTATYFGLAHDVGMLAPGRFADLLLVPDLESFHVEQVIAKGQLAAQEGSLSLSPPSYSYSGHARQTVRVGRRLLAEDFHFSVQDLAGAADVRVIGVQDGRMATQSLRRTLPVESGNAIPDPGQDIAMLAMVDRHHGSGNIRLAFVHGFGLQSGCAAGSTIAHDSHHMLVVGTDPVCMARAANALVDMQGGHVVVRDENILAQLPLPIAGLLSDRPAQDVAVAIVQLVQAYRACGCRLGDPHMQLTRMSLVCIPALRLSDRGLVDVEAGRILPVLLG